MAEALLARLVKIVVFWIPLGLATAAALLPQGPPMPFAVSDVILHAFAFTYLTAALGLAHYRPGGVIPVALWMLGYGVALEAVQSFIPERSAELKDLAVDALGIALGLGVWRIATTYAIPRLPGWRGRGR